MIFGEKTMVRGKTRCPRCKHSFIIDIPKEHEKHKVMCPNCESTFIIKTSEKSDKDFHWEEHGEPRKTILSSIRPKTNKPNIAAILLVCVFAIGIITASFPEMFIESSSDAINAAGLTGTVFIEFNETNKTLENITVKVDGMTRTVNSSFRFKDVKLGIKKLTINSKNYSNLTKEILVTPFFESAHTIDLKEGRNHIEEQYNTNGCTIIIVIFSVFAMLSAIACVKRFHIDVAVAGSIIAILSVGFFMIGSIISIIAFVLIFLSRDEFDNGKKGKQF
jgi:DNA-directed RNA polymerase subunit RPC12/RpoP/uncharacterized membrane protein